MDNTRRVTGVPKIPPMSGKLAKPVLARAEAVSAQPAVLHRQGSDGSPRAPVTVGNNHTVFFVIVQALRRRWRVSDLRTVPPKRHTKTGPNRFRS